MLIEENDLNRAGNSTRSRWNRNRNSNMRLEEPRVQDMDQARPYRVEGKSEAQESHQCSACNLLVRQNCFQWISMCW